MAIKSKNNPPKIIIPDEVLLLPPSPEIMKKNAIPKTAKATKIGKNNLKNKFNRIVIYA